MNLADMVSRLMDTVAGDLADMVEDLAREGMAEMERVQRQLRNQARRRRPAVATPTPAVVKRSRRRAAPGQSQARQAPPPPPAPGPSAIDIATAACILGEFTGIAPSDIVKDDATRKRAIRAAARKVAPGGPAGAGDHEAMVKVNWAREIFDPRNQGGSK